MNHVKEFFQEEDGVGVVEVILILVVKSTTKNRACIKCIK